MVWRSVEVVFLDPKILGMVDIVDVVVESKQVEKVVVSRPVTGQNFCHPSVHVGIEDDCMYRGVTKVLATQIRQCILAHLYILFILFKHIWLS